MNVALLAALAMVIQDLVGVLLVQAEARNRAWQAAACDSLMWLAGISTTSISVTALQGHSLHEKVLVVVFVSLANVIGTFSGVLIGKKFIKSEEPARSCACACAGCNGNRATMGAADGSATGQGE